MSVGLVTGGSGTLGGPLVRLLRERGYQVRVLSRSPRRGTHVGDLLTGECLATAAAGVDLVVDAASGTRRFGQRDLQQKNRLLEYVGPARHLLYVSIVGIDAIPFSYYQRKLACEKAISAAGVPYTSLRATQFHELF